MHQAPQTLDLSFLENSVGQGCIYRVPRHILLLYDGSASSHHALESFS